MRSLYVDDIPGTFGVIQVPSQQNEFIRRKLIEKSTMRRFIDLQEIHKTRGSLIGTLLQKK